MKPWPFSNTTPLPVARGVYGSCPGRHALIIGLLLFVASGVAIAQPSTFAIWKGNSVVGKVYVDRKVQGERTQYVMTSRAEVQVLWTQRIRTSASTEYLGGRLMSCHTSVNVNDELRDSTRMHGVDGRWSGYLHPGRTVPVTCRNPWSTARMYYEEPLGQQTVYVESVLADCPLRRISEGVYQLTLPDGHVNRYVYRNGVLQEIQVDRLFFDLVFRRV